MHSAPDDPLDSAYQRLARHLGFPPSDSFRRTVEAERRPGQVLNRLEAWLSASSTPEAFYYQLQASPPTARLLLQVLGSSQHLSNLLIQNPQLSSILLDLDGLVAEPTLAQLLDEGRRLLGQSTSYAHQLDRLRYLKQKHTLALAARDLAGLWPPRRVWQGISTLAEAVIRLAAESVWQSICAGEPEAVSIVGMGKLGGDELNYSSDIDLVFILAEDASEKMEKTATRFGEMLRAALADRMGRGALYRVDLRLRPYGNAGPLVPRFSAVEAYYAKYSEPWEQMALVRSRLLSGPGGADLRWEDLRSAHAFKPTRTEWAVENLLHMRSRMEGIAEPGDIKRGPGGIRDVEFLVQIMQFVFGGRDPSLRCRGTFEAINALATAGLLPPDAAAELWEGYEFLRQCEHRCQLGSDLQTHTVPSSPDGLENLAALMGFGQTEAFSSQLARHRSTIRKWYDKLTPGRAQVALKEQGMSQSVQLWVHSLPFSDDYFRAVAENKSSLQRLEHIALNAPALLADLGGMPEVSELVINGEIEAAGGPKSSGFENRDAESLPTAYRTARMVVLANAALCGLDGVGTRLASLADSVLLRVVHLAGNGLVPLACGSFAAQELSPHSDHDIVLLARPGVEWDAAEAQGQRVVQTTPFEIDLRLRPEGRKGFVVVTPDGLRAYGAERMEAWERLALRRSRLVTPCQEVSDALLSCVWEYAWSEEDVQELLKMKHRIETERISPQISQRHIKLGPGGLEDILWLLQFHSVLSGARPWVSVSDGIKELARLGALNIVEAGQLADAHAFLTGLRIRIQLMGFPDDLLPENPDKLSQLSQSMDIPTANDLLRQTEDHRACVQALFEAFKSGRGG